MADPTPTPLTDAEHDALEGHEFTDMSTQDTYGNETEVVGCTCGRWAQNANLDTCYAEWWDHVHAEVFAAREAAARADERERMLTPSFVLRRVAQTMPHNPEAVDWLHIQADGWEASGVIAAPVETDSRVALAQSADTRRPTLADLVCPTCGPTATETHPRRPGVTRCSNCKEHLAVADPTADAVRATLRSHQWAATNEKQTACSCDRTWRSTPDYYDHLARVVSAAITQPTDTEGA